MTVIFLVLPLAVFFSGLAVVAFLWSARSGQLDDLETPPLRALRDEGRREQPSASVSRNVPATTRAASNRPDAKPADAAVPHAAAALAARHSRIPRGFCALRALARSVLFSSSAGAVNPAGKRDS